MSETKKKRVVKKSKKKAAHDAVDEKIKKEVKKIEKAKWYWNIGALKGFKKGHRYQFTSSEAKRIKDFGILFKLARK